MGQDNNRPVNRTNDGVKQSNSLTASSGKHEWHVVRKLHEVGGERQREMKKIFASPKEAKDYFEEQAVLFRNKIGRCANASIIQSDSELLIKYDGIEIVNISFLTVPLQCA